MTHEHPAECCFTCRFHKIKGSRCRRYPPTVFFDINEVKWVTAYPNTNQDMWCGEFQLHPAPTGRLEDPGIPPPTGASAETEGT